MKTGLVYDTDHEAQYVTIDELRMLGEMVRLVAEGKEDAALKASARFLSESPSGRQADRTTALLAISLVMAGRH